VNGETNTAVPLLRTEENIDNARAVEVIRFELTHARNLPPVAETMLQLYLNCGEGWTLLEDGEPVAACGIIACEGRGSAWGLVGERAKQMPFALHRYTKRIMLGIMARHDLRRVDMVVDPLNEAAKRWAEALGFTYEGTMRNFYLDGRGAYLMARISEVR
jgi:hypothetical protein